MSDSHFSLISDLTASSSSVKPDLTLCVSDHKLRSEKSGGRHEERKCITCDHIPLEEQQAEETAPAKETQEEEERINNMNIYTVKIQ